MDVLSDVLRHVRLTGAVFFDVDAAAPWVAEAPAGSALAPHVMPGAQHVMEYHAVTSGRCYGGLIDAPATALEAGDIIMFPQGDAHVMSSSPGMRGAAEDVGNAIAQASRLPIVTHQGKAGPAEAHVVCGFITCDLRPFNPLVAALPRVLVSRGAEGRRGAPLEQLMRYAADEAGRDRAGAACVLTKLSELLFVEIVRDYLQALPEERTGWLSGLRDPHVGKALSRMHATPAEALTLDSLARAAGLSRSALAERFSALVGMAPMQYLTRWRMQLAASLLTGGDLGLAEIATRTGYQSEAAFSRAFKKATGVSPARYGRAQR